MLFLFVSRLLTARLLPDHHAVTRLRERLRALGIPQSNLAARTDLALSCKQSNKLFPPCQSEGRNLIFFEIKEKPGI